MKQKLKVYDYATTMRISVPTVYRRIKAGKLETEEIDGVTYVLVDEEQLNNIQQHAVHMVLPNCGISQKSKSKKGKKGHSEPSIDLGYD